jgi:hypothetical protein
VLPVAIAFVHPVKVESCDFVAVVIVGGAEAVIESASVGGAFAYVSFQISTTIEPDWSANIVTRLIVHTKGISRSPFMPVVIADPPPSMMNVIDTSSSCMKPRVFHPAILLFYNKIKKIAQ